MSASSAVPSTVSRSPSAPDAVTTAGAVVALGCTFVGNFVETPWKDDPGWGVDFHGHGGWSALGITIAFVLVTLVLVGLATARARAAAPESTATRALILAGLGVLALAAYYLGLPSVLAAGAGGLALDARRRLGRFTAASAIALVLAALTVACAVYLAFTG